MNKKIAVELAVGIIILVSLALGGLFLFQGKKPISSPAILNPYLAPTQNQNQTMPVEQSNNLPTEKIYTDSWDTYHISQYGCKFKYPREWEPFSNLKTSSESDNFNVQNPKNKAEVFSLFITSDKSFVENKHAVPSKKTIGGLPAMEYTTSANCDGNMAGKCPSFTSLYVKRDNYFYIFNFGNNDITKSESTLDIILSTFEFTAYNVVEEQTFWAK